MKTMPPTRPIRPSEEGYMLVAVIFIMAILILAMAVAAPKMARSIQRDRDLDTMHRGKQYIRALKLYYAKFGAYPPNVDALVKPTNGIRFLRKKYIDPTSGKDEWKPIMFGQNKTVPLGFFGQPIGGSTVAGTGPGASGTGLNGASGQSGLFNNSTTNSAAASDPNVAGTITGVNSTNQVSGQTDGQTSGQTNSQTFGQTSGQTYGGAGIIGFAPTSPKKSVLVWRKKNHYNEWEFTFDPAADRIMNSGMPIQQGSGPSGNGSGIGGNGSGFGGNSFNSGGNNSSSSSGNSNNSTPSNTGSTSQ